MQPKYRINIILNNVNIKLWGYFHISTLHHVYFMREKECKQLLTMTHWTVSRVVLLFIFSVPPMLIIFTIFKLSVFWFLGLQLYTKKFSYFKVSQLIDCPPACSSVTINPLFSLSFLISNSPELWMFGYLSVKYLNVFCIDLCQLLLVPQPYNT